MRLLSDVVSWVADPYLRHAASLALRAQGRTAPNPLVGCVVVSDGHIVGEGYHPRAGQPHAEVFALAAAGRLARGADVYVTLEPCAHFGRTAPCADALVAAGVARVIIGMPDPSAEAGGGAQRLSDAGIAVEFADDAGPFEAINEAWLHRVRSGRPFVTVKLALTLDGRLGMQAGERTSITGSDGSIVTRALREAADAVLVGAATVVADDPALTRRDVVGQPAEEQPLRVVLARSVVPHADARVFSDKTAPTLLVVVGDATVPPLDERVAVTRLAHDASLVDIMLALGTHGVTDLLVEAGGRLFGSLLAEGLIDQLITVTAGGFAGADAPVLPLTATTVTESEIERVLVPVETGIVGDVIATAWRPRTASQHSNSVKG
ncbi:MAG TPA: bifunctional diaminohydroxyphosphoribosylaminopyrimidine deaminase/5-amino-6-(5-phosphoribosylamino)uracil reductase RibD [Coriobacteriia bacterium]|nr:bifunctional diaminohydroxyphosphoribosylaminopyrimidine deaminase/5-amino-6-(5-phosphoribosylamino)uracil reductase RibD [Coriobacteriia bacterium]